MDPFLQWLSSSFGGVGAAPAPMGPTAAMGPVMGPTIEQMNGVSPWDPAPLDSMAQAPPGSPGATPQGANPLATALRGIAPPQVPTPQRVSTPGAPRQGEIQGGELLKLLLAQQAAGGAGGRQITPLPSTLGQALNAPRY